MLTAAGARRSIVMVSSELRYNLGVLLSIDH